MNKIHFVHIFNVYATVFNRFGRNGSRLDATAVIAYANGYNGHILHIPRLPNYINAYQTQPSTSEVITYPHPPDTKVKKYKLVCDNFISSQLVRS